MTTPTTTPATDTEKAVALAALAANLGNVKQTARDIGRDPSTLRRWRDENPETYKGLEDKAALMVEQEILQRARQNAQNAGMAVEDAIRLAKEKLESTSLPATDLSRIARDLSQVHSQNVDKVLTLTGRPAVITESRELVALVQSLEADGVLRIKQPADAEGTVAEETTDAGA